MYEIVDLNTYHDGLWLYELLATWMAPRIPSVVRRDGRVTFVFIDPEKTEVLEDEGHKWRRWLGRTVGGTTRASSTFWDEDTLGERLSPSV